MINKGADRFAEEIVTILCDRWNGKNNSGLPLSCAKMIRFAASLGTGHLPTFPEAREAAARVGWVRRNELDYCPQHAGNGGED